METMSREKKVSMGLSDDIEYKKPIVQLKSIEKESFSKFDPIKVICEVNGQKVTAVIDTGAQVSVMSSSCAKHCGITHNIDTRYSGKAIGMGSTDILGRVDDIPIKVGNTNFRGQLSILRDSPQEFLLGIDFLRHFKAQISVGDNSMTLQLKDKQIHIPLISSSSGANNKGLESVNNLGLGPDGTILPAVSLGWSGEDGCDMMTNKPNSSKDVAEKEEILLSIYGEPEEYIGEPVSMEGV
jgi:hypothetical protein